MAWLRSIPYRGWLLAALLAAHFVSLINPADHFDMMLEHVPSAALILFLVWVDRRQPLSKLAYTLIFCFMLLHVLGAHYLYSNVPYDRWSEAIFGVRVSDLVHTQRNHYDRFVHLMFGLLMVQPTSELVQRWLKIPAGAALIVAVLVLAVLSKTYELLEWAIAVVMAPDAAERYNGQQGDMFDAHKDMALALGGSLVSAAIIWAVRRRSANDAGS